MSLHYARPARLRSVVLAVTSMLLSLALVGGVSAPAASAAAGTQVANRDYGYPYPNAPDCTEVGSDAGCVVDAWNFYQGQCTSWVAFRVNSRNGLAFSNQYGGGARWGDASNWGAKARSLGIPVNDTPAVGAIVWYASGHVGYVEEVRGDGTVVMSEMNRDNHNGFGLTVISRGSRWPSGFIHVKDLAGPGPSIGEGTFVRSVDTNRVYRVAGGAPIYVSSWNAFGGGQPVVDRSEGEINAMRSRPADGTLVSSTATGRVYVIVGGAPTYVSNFANIGGARPVIGIDQWALDNVGNPHAHLSDRPADGTFAVSGITGRVYIFAGGAPIYVSTWAAFGGGKPTVTIDQWAIDNWADPNAHVNNRPADGSLISSTATGRVYVVAGGAPLYVSNFDAIGGARPVTPVDQWALDNIADPHAHLSNRPADGTFVNTSTGKVYRFAGGAPLYLSKWEYVGGQQPSTRIDQWAIDTPQDPNAHTDRIPRPGTVMQALPSTERWTMVGPRRQRTPGTPAAVGVDRGSLFAVPEVLSASGGLSVAQGSSGTLALTGTGLRSSDVVSGGGTGITYGALVASASGDALSVTVSAAASATVGRKDLTVRGADGVSVRCDGCLEVTAPPTVVRSNPTPTPVRPAISIPTPTPTSTPAPANQVLATVTRVQRRTVTFRFGRALPASAKFRVKGRPDIVSRTVVREKAGKRFRVTFEIPGAIPGKAVKVAISAGGRSLTKVVRLGRA